MEFLINSKDLKDLLNKNKNFMGNEEFRYYLNGLFLHIDDNKEYLIGVATDGHRLSRVKMIAPQGSQNMPDVIIPRKTVLELSKLIKDIESDIKIEFIEKGDILFFNSGTGELIIHSKLVDGTFPDYRSVIPTVNNNVLRVNKKEISGKLNAIVLRVPRKRGILATLDIIGGKTTIKTHDISLEMGLIHYDGVNLEIGFNPRYMLEIIRKIKSEEIIIEMGDKGDPFKIWGVDDDALFLLMPCRI